MVRALGIPTVMGADIQPSVLHRRTLVVDGYTPSTVMDPVFFPASGYTSRVVGAMAGGPLAG